MYNIATLALAAVPPISDIPNGVPCDKRANRYVMTSLASLD